MKLPITEQELNNFLREAMRNCYLGEFKKAEVIERPGFFEMYYQSGDLSYRDSFTGYYLTAGQEIIRQKEIPIWSMSYRGGVVDNYIGDVEMFKKIESFLRRSLGSEESSDFRPRGPKSFAEDQFKYECNWEGDIKAFKGTEIIYLNDKKIFYHDFFGGVILGK